MEHLVERMVEGGNSGNQLMRFAQGEDLAGFPMWRDITGEDLPVILQCLHSGKLQHVMAPADLVGRLLETEPCLLRDERRELLCSFGKHAPGLVEDFIALVAGQGLAAFEGCFDRLDGFSFPQAGDGAGDLSCIGVIDGQFLIA